MSYKNYDNILTMMEFTEVLRNEPKKAFNFICNNGYKFEKTDLINIIKELLYGIQYHTDNRSCGNLFPIILEDVQIELDEKYDDLYKEYYDYIDKKKENKNEIK